MPILVEAVIDLDIRDYTMLDRERNADGFRNYVVLSCGNLCKLMTGIRNVKTLTFSCETLEVIKFLFCSLLEHEIIKAMLGKVKLS